MVAMIIFFWIAVLLLLYSYLLYGALVWGLLKLQRLFSKRPKNYQDSFVPEVTLLIAAYNEGEYLHKKISNCLDLRYPTDKLKILFVTDGSDDNSNEIIQGYPQLHGLFQPERRGKVAAINRAMKFVETPYVIFCDANTDLNPDCISEIVKHYQFANVGGVAGEKIVRDPSHTGTAGAGEGLYWKYESFLKKLDSEFYSVVGAAGELFSIRTDLYFEVPENVLLDDFIISLKIAEKGYRIQYEPKAFAIEAPSFNIHEEQKRKIRIGAGGFQSIVMLKSLFNFFKHPKLSFLYVSHRVLRWAVCPFLLPVILVLNMAIYAQTKQTLYGMLFIGQVIFYLAASIGYMQALDNKKSKLFYVPFYFIFMNVCMYFGLIRFLKNKQSVLWEKAVRKKTTENEIPNAPPG